MMLSALRSDRFSKNTEPLGLGFRSQLGAGSPIYIGLVPLTNSLTSMLFFIFLFIFMTVVSARPLVLPAKTPPIAKFPIDPTAQSTLSSSSNSTSKLRTLNDLYLGNQKFRQNAHVQAEKLVDEGVWPRRDICSLLPIS
jgi:hypothetical protein